MRRIILFSQPEQMVLEEIKPLLFADFIKEKVFAYMPSDGSDVEANLKYTPFWQKYVWENEAEFIEVNNSRIGEEALLEKNKLQKANILMITGGNTFKLLANLRKSGLDQAIKEFWKKENVVLSGFSAGAIIITPSIRTSKDKDLNETTFTDLSGLGIVDFEVWPHYALSQKEEVDQFEKEHRVKLEIIRNEEFFVFDYGK